MKKGGSMESLERMVKIMFSPKNTFEKIQSSPNIVLPIIILTLCAIAVMGYYANNADFAAIMEQRIESNEKLQQLSQVQKDKFIEQQNSNITKYSMIFAPVIALPVYFFIVGLYFFLAAKIAGKELSYIQSVSISVYSNSVMLLSTLVTFIVMFTTDFSTTPIEYLLPSNLGYYFSAEQVGSKIFTVLTKIDFFKLWTLILSTIGLSVMAKMKTWVSSLIVFIPFILFSALALLFV
jgi:hypothetical protein